MTAKTKFAISTLVSVALALGGFLFILMISHQNNHKWDLTQGQRFSLSPQSLQVVRELHEPVQILVFLAETDDRGRQQATELLDNYKAAAPQKFSYQLVDPKKSPLVARKHDVRMPGQVVLLAGAKTQRVTAVAEEELTNALLKLSDLAQKKVYFVSGHGERISQGEEAGAISRFRAALAKEGFEGADLNLIQQKAVPGDAAVLVLAGPTTEMLPPEQQALKNWLGKGGSLLVMLELETGQKYDWLLKDYFVKSPSAAIVDEQSQLFGTQPVNVIALEYAADHPVTRNFKINTVFPLTRPVEPVAQGLPQGAAVIPLVFTLPSALTVAPEELETLQSTGRIHADRILHSGRVSLAVASAFPVSATPTASPSPAGSPAPAGKKTRLVVVGDADFASNEVFEALGNKDLALNMLNWLTESEDRITIRPKDESGQPLVLSQTQTYQVKILLILAIPAAVLLAGFMTTFRRRG